MLNLSGWPVGRRVITRTERPHPGAQLRITDPDGHRVIAFAINSVRGQLPDLELRRRRRRARAQDRIRICIGTGLTNLPLHGYTQNQLWLAVVSLAVELTAWLHMLAFTDHPARRWEPERLRLRLFAIAGRLIRHARRSRLRLSVHPPGHTSSNPPSTIRKHTPPPPDQQKSAPTRPHHTATDPAATAAVLVASLTYPTVLDALIGRRPGEVDPAAYLRAWVDTAIATLLPGPGRER